MRTRSVFLSASLAAALAGCAHPGPHGGRMDDESMASMCAQHARMMAATPEERQAWMERRMEGMTPEMRERHLEMMRQRCAQQ